MAKSWYPVIDYTNCDECGTCINKCSHGVYDKLKAPTPVVSNPENCIDHCHGCGNLCPNGAITYVGEDTGWTPPNGVDLEDAELCCCGCDDANKQLVIDFLYLDLNTCARCISTGSTLNEAIDELADVLNTLGYNIIVNRINISSPELAEQYHFLSSPTIRVNGQDICLEIKENACGDCGDICGDDVECRVFVYEDAEYSEPPKAMIIDGILRAIYNPQTASDDIYTLPDNLRRFFTGKKNSCCDGDCCCSGECNE